MSFGEGLWMLAMQELANQLTKTGGNQAERRPTAPHLGGLLSLAHWRSVSSIGPDTCMARVVPALVHPLTLTSYFASGQFLLRNVQFVTLRVHSLNLSVVSSRVNVKAFKGKGVPNLCANQFSVLSRRKACAKPIFNGADEHA
jgi:hypothetical protein